MEYVKAAIGDTVWVYYENHQGVKTSGKVINIFDYFGTEKYVIALPTGIDDILIVYDGLTISDAETKPIGFWRKF